MILEANLPQMDATEIYLNVNKLYSGEYQLFIMDKNKLLEHITFKK